MCATKHAHSARCAGKKFVVIRIVVFATLPAYVRWMSGRCQNLQMNVHSKELELRTLLEKDLASHKQLYELKLLQSTREVLEADLCKLVQSEAPTIGSCNRQGVTQIRTVSSFVISSCQSAFPGSAKNANCLKLKPRNSCHVYIPVLAWG